MKGGFARGKSDKGKDNKKYGEYLMSGSLN